MGKWVNNSDIAVHLCWNLSKWMADDRNWVLTVEREFIDKQGKEASVSHMVMD